jgi:hypothetical protein
MTRFVVLSFDSKPIDPPICNSEPGDTLSKSEYTIIYDSGVQVCCIEKSQKLDRQN